jgi:hypothetical protein
MHYESLSAIVIILIEVSSCGILACLRTLEPLQISWWILKVNIRRLTNLDEQGQLRDTRKRYGYVQEMQALSRSSLPSLKPIVEDCRYL